MAIPLQVQLFDAFLGTEEGIHSVILPDIYSSGGSINVYMDKYARVKKIPGYTEVNGTAVTSNGGGFATRVLGLFPFRSIVAGTTTRQIIGVFENGVDEWEIWKSDNSGGSWSFVFDASIGPVGFAPDFAQFGNILYITNGKTVPKQWNGSALSTVGRTQSPTVTPLVSATPGALNGTYRWKLVSMIGKERQAASASSVTLVTTAVAPSGNQFDLSWTADANTNVTGYELYRTTGTGNVFYFVKYIDIRTTTTAIDNVTDVILLENRVLIEHGDPPPTAYYCEGHKSRMWWGRTDTYPTRAYWSDPGLPGDVWESNFLDFADGDTFGDTITGMIGNVEGKLVVFTERAVWTVSGTGQVIGTLNDWSRLRTNAQIGAVTGRSAVKVPAGAKYIDQEGKPIMTQATTLAYMTPNKDIRLFDGTNDVIISNPVKDSLADLNYEFRRNCFAMTDGEHNEISWHYPSGSEGLPDKCVVWNYKWGLWFVREWAFGAGVEIETSADSSVLIAGSRSTATDPGHVYQLMDGTSFDGADIEAAWMTKTLYGVNSEGQPAVSNLKRWRWADFMFEAEQTAPVTIEWFIGDTPDVSSPEGSVIVSPAKAYVLTAEDDRILSANFDPIAVSLASNLIRVRLKNATADHLHSEGVRLRISDNDQNGSWSLESMNLAYQIMPGLQRRF